MYLKIEHKLKFKNGEIKIHLYCVDTVTENQKDINTLG